MCEWKGAEARLDGSLSDYILISTYQMDSGHMLLSDVTASSTVHSYSTCLHMTGLFSFVQGWNKPGFIPGFFRPGRNTFVQKLVDKTGNNLKHDGIVILPALKWGFEAVSESTPRTAHVHNPLRQWYRLAQS